MRKQITATLVTCDRRGCGNTWVDGHPTRARHTPMPCAVLTADFCSADCHRSAHTNEAHGQTWRRRGSMPKRVLRASTLRGY